MFDTLEIIGEISIYKVEVVEISDAPRSTYILIKI